MLTSARWEAGILAVIAGSLGSHALCPCRRTFKNKTFASSEVDRLRNSVLAKFVKKCTADTNEPAPLYQGPRGALGVGCRRGLSTALHVGLLASTSTLGYLFVCPKKICQTPPQIILAPHPSNPRDLAIHVSTGFFGIILG